MRTDRPTAADLVQILGLEPHPAEGGYFTETWRSAESHAAADLPDRYGGDRAYGTAIYYLLTPGTQSALHRLRSDEVFCFLLGDAAEMLHLRPDGTSRIVRLGSDVRGGEQLKVVVPAGVWQGMRLAVETDAAYALFATIVAPGFDFADYEHGRRDELVAAWPEHTAGIERLTPAQPVAPAPQSPPAPA